MALRLLLLPAAALALQVAPLTPAVRPTAVARAAPPAMFDIDMNVIIGAGTLIASIGGGIAVIQFTEGAGKANEERNNQQPCVVCKTAKVNKCTICQGSGQDSLADYVKGVQDMAGEAGGVPPPPGVSTVTIDDWEVGEISVEMYSDILKDYPIIATESVCVSCDGRGVVVCDNCQGTGIQPRFLERFSPDDFMD